MSENMTLQTNHLIFSHPIYGMQDARPRIAIALWKANLEEPKFYHTDTSVIIVDNSTSNSLFSSKFR